MDFMRKHREDTWTIADQPVILSTAVEADAIDDAVAIVAEDWPSTSPDAATDDVAACVVDPAMVTNPDDEMPADEAIVAEPAMATLAEEEAEHAVAIDTAPELTVTDPDDVTADVVCTNTGIL